MKRLKLKRQQKKETTLLVDLKYLCYRARYTSGSQLSYNEVNTTINYMLFSTLLSVAKKFNITKCVICADLGTGSIRKEEYPNYKNKKSYNKSDYDIKLDELFKGEYENILDELQSLGMFPNVALRYEADDLIARYCLDHKQNETIIIISRDEDLYQCLDETVSVYSPDDKLRKTDKWFKKKYGIEPKDWSMVKAIGGCKSDTVEGIKGVGEETALKYLLGTANPNQIKKIDDNKETVKLCHQVVVLPHPTFKLKKPFKQTKLKEDEFIVYCQNFGLRKHLDHLHEFCNFFS